MSTESARKAAEAADAIEDLLTDYVEDTDSGTFYFTLEGKKKAIAIIAAACQTVAPPPEFESDETPNGTTTFDLKTSAGEFYLETGRTKFSAHFKPVSGETQYYEGMMCAAPAVSTPPITERELICPKCHAEFEDDGKEHPAGILCPECKGTVKGVIHPRAIRTNAAVSTPRCPELAEFLSLKIWDNWHGPLCSVPPTHEACAKELLDWLNEFFQPAPSPPGPQANPSRTPEEIAAANKSGGKANNRGQE